MDDQLGNGERSLLCRKCGAPLLQGSQFCKRCGQKIGMGTLETWDRRADDDPWTISRDMGEARRSVAGEDVWQTGADARQIPELGENGAHKKGKRWIWLTVLGLFALCGIALAVWMMLPQKVEPQDINAINGCPEFYDVEFGMKAEEASALVKVKHETVGGSLLYLAEGAKYSVYGLPVSDVLCGFPSLRMENVYISFSNEKVSRAQVVELYREIYGEPDQEGTTYVVWKGKKTTIGIYDFSEDNETVVGYRSVLSYEPDVNEHYHPFDFSVYEKAAETLEESLEDLDSVFGHDPYFLLMSDVFGKKVSDYASQFPPEEDYTVNEYGEYTQYIFYPDFSYMGIDEGYTAISLETEGDTIWGAGYLFLLDETNAVDRMTYIRDVLTEKYGLHVSCDYTSMKHDEVGIVDLAPEEAMSRIGDGTQGIYHMQWETGTFRVTLELTIYESDEYYYEGAVVYALM